MRFLVSVPNFGEFADVREVVAFAGEVESAGWDGFFTWDHVVFDTSWSPPASDPWVALTAVALATERMRIGTLVAPLSRRQPWKVARETVTLDHLSNGRLTLGVGLGVPADADFVALGEEADDRARAARLDEALDVITGLWRGERFHHEGVHFRVDGVTFVPKPVQQPRIPIWCSATYGYRAPLRRAARYDGVAPLKATEKGIESLTTDEVAEIVAYIREHRETEAPFDVAIGGPPPWDGSYDWPAALRAYEQAGATWWVESCGWEPGSFDDLRRRVKDGPPR